MPYVIAIGDINLDIIATFSSYPEPGGDARAAGAEMHCGGSAANMAACLGRLGVEAGLVGRVGADPWGDHALASLRAAGVDLQAVQRDPSELTGMMYIVVTPGGERTMLGHRGANVYTNPEQVRAANIRVARWLHLSGYALLCEPQCSAARLALEQARRHGLRVSLDPGLRPCQEAEEGIQRLLAEVDWVVPNLREAQTLTGERQPEACAARLRELGAGAIAIKLGSKGCLLAVEGTLRRLPAFAVAARDSTGAGDAFAAGLVGGLVGGLSWQAAAVLANALGALVATRTGGGSAAPTRPEVQAFLQAQQRGARWDGQRTTLQEVMAWLNQGSRPA
jgi:ribokinase